MGASSPASPVGSAVEPTVRAVCAPPGPLVVELDGRDVAVAAVARRVVAAPVVTVVGATAMGAGRGSARRPSSGDRRVDPPSWLLGARQPASAARSAAATANLEMGTAADDTEEEYRAAAANPQWSPRRMQHFDDAPWRGTVKKGLLGLLAVTALAVAPAAHAGAPAGGNGSRTGGLLRIACNDGVVRWSPLTIWPPNHRMQTVDITYDENDNDRDEITVTCTDTGGNHDRDGRPGQPQMQDVRLTVAVPHDQGHR